MDPNDVRALIECPVCLEVPRDPTVYMCKKSHNICKPCFHGLGAKDCPVGRTCGFLYETDGVPQRNRSIEGMVQQWKHKCSNHTGGCSFTGRLRQITEHEAACRFGVVGCRHEGCTFSAPRTSIGSHQDTCPYKPSPCKHRGNGCPAEVVRKDLEFHETECRWRKVPCPDGDCNKGVVLANLDPHMKEVHKADTWPFKTDINHQWCYLREDILASRSNSWLLATSQVDGETFVWEFQKIEGIYYAWVYIIGGPRKAERFSCKMSVQDREGKYRQVVTCPVIPIDYGRQKVVREGSYLSLTNGEVRRCMTEDVIDNAYARKECYSYWIKIGYEIKQVR